MTMCKLAVATTRNNEAMPLAVREVARRYISGRTLAEEVPNRIAVAILAFDPCLLCATHAAGAMPLVVELLDSDAMHVDRRDRD